MAVANGEIVKAVAEFTLGDGTIVQNVFHFIAEVAAPVAKSLVLSAVQSYIEDIYTGLAAYISDDVETELATVHVIEWDPGEGEWVTERLLGNTLPDLTFTASTDAYPNQISGVLIGNTDRPKSRGRKFLVPFVETAGVGSSIISAVMSLLATSLSHYLADETIADTDVLSPGIPRSGFDQFLAFSDGVVNSILGTQRRRKPGVGA